PALAGEAIAYATLAATEAASRSAYEDSCTHLERALATADAADVLPEKRLDLRLALADARHRAGRSAAARASWLAGAGLARTLAGPAALARAALGLHRLGARTGSPEPVVRGLLTEADAALSTAVLSTMDDLVPVRALVLAALAREA